MSSKDKKESEWAEAKRKCRLNEETVKMAKEMGLNPRIFIEKDFTLKESNSLTKR